MNGVQKIQVPDDHPKFEVVGVTEAKPKTVKEHLAELEQQQGRKATRAERRYLDQRVRKHSGQKRKYGYE